MTSAPTGTERCAWFHCFAGTAGDMTLGALIDAGADPGEVVAALNGLGLDGWAVTFEAVTRCTLRATHAVVVTEHEHEHEHGHGHEHDHEHHHAHHHEHRPYREIRALLDRADLPPRVRTRAQATFRLLAEVEGRMHGVDPDEVELHEVGSLDAIVDIVGVCAALESLGIGRIACSPITTGMGTVGAAHGRIPHPAPAVVEMLARRGAPMIGIDSTMELATPTGVALMCALADTFGPLPAMAITAAGYGAGSADPRDRPNVVQVLIGTENAASRPAHSAVEPMAIAEANVDDATGEELAHAVGELLAAGANDAWISPIVMKKGRPASTVHLLAPIEQITELGELLGRMTGSIGWRWWPVQRHAQQRSEVTVDVGGHVVRVKRTVQGVKAEFDDAARVAAATGTTLRAVSRAAERAAEDGGAGKP